MKRVPSRRRYLYVLAGLCLLAAACAPVYLNPGANPARIEVEFSAKANPALLQYPSEVVYWDWGFNLVVPQGPFPQLQPTEPQQLKVITGVNPLVRKVTFLAPAGKHTYLFNVSGYVMRTKGMGTVPVDLMNYEQKLTLDLAPGQVHSIKWSLPPAR